MMKVLKNLLFSSLLLIGCFYTGLLSADTASAPEPTGVPVNGVVAIVNNDVITYQDLMDATAQTISQAKAQNLALPDQTTIEQHVLQNLIMQKIALQLATLNNITASDAQVDQVIAGIAKQNNFSVSELYSKLSTQGIDQEFYQSSIRTQIIIQQLEQAEVANAIIITPSQVDNYLAVQARTQNANAEYDVGHILIALPDNPTADDYARAKEKASDVVQKIKNGMPFNEAAMTYSDSSDASTGGDLGYETVNQLPIAFIEPVTSMKVGDVVGPIATDGGFSIITLLAQKGGVANMPHYVKEYHLQSILIKSSPVLNDSEVKAQLERITLALNNGKSFAEEAEAYSQDYFTNQEGGDMGFVNPAKLNPILASYLQTAAVGSISPPLQTPDGWYLIKVLGTREVDNTAAYQRQQAEQALFQQKATEALQAWQAQMKSFAYINILDPELAGPTDDSGS